MNISRAGGVLLHPTSLPGRYGIGDVGENGLRFLDFLTRAGLQYWQILPLGPTGYGNSPYQTLSAFAGNPMLISLDSLVKDELLRPADLARAPWFAPRKIDYGSVIDFHKSVLAVAHERFAAGANPALRVEFEAFCDSESDWLQDYALFRALKNEHAGIPWVEWPSALVRRTAAALKRWTTKLDTQIEAAKFDQFLFYRQWQALKDAAAEKNIRIVGDIPIFVAHDSADVWANQSLFDLNAAGSPRHVAGVPPDYFSETGQLWGNPLYRWERMAETGYGWWIARMQSTFRTVDIVRLDHFRGFESYWEIPSTAETAVTGSWQPGPKHALFDKLQEVLGELPIIAEDLGVITPEVEDLRDRYSFPGMKILQFAFGSEGGTSDFLPHNYDPHCVVYTGTHDNDTTRGWYLSPPVKNGGASQHQLDRERDHARRYMATDGREIHWDMIRLAFSSVARLAVVPLQDFLGLDGSGRMNLPSRPDNNWEWRFDWQDIDDGLIGRISEMAWLFDRHSDKG